MWARHRSFSGKKFRISKCGESVGPREGFWLSEREIVGVLCSADCGMFLRHLIKLDFPRRHTSVSQGYGL
jgi:hypothetical protein